jgi:hypothetical protein
MGKGVILRLFFNPKQLRPLAGGCRLKQRKSWRAWEVFLAALFGLPLEGEDAAAIYARQTGGPGRRLRQPVKPG